MTLGFAAGFAGCVLAPYGTRDEQAKLNAVSPAFEPRIEARQIPEMPAVATCGAALAGKHAQPITYVRITQRNVTI